MALLHHQEFQNIGQFSFNLSFFFFFFNKQASKSNHLCFYLMSNNNDNNNINNNDVIEPSHVQFIKIKNHSADIHMLRYTERLFDKITSCDTSR